MLDNVVAIANRAIAVATLRTASRRHCSNQRPKLLAIVLSATGLLASGLSVTAAAQTQSSFVWQGFEHEWRRFVILPKEGRVPHRISRFSSYVDNSSSNENNATIEGSMHFAQSTGVDGNYMRPKGFYSAVRTDSAWIINDKVEFTWTDNIQDQEIPISENEFIANVDIDLSLLPEINSSDLNALNGAAILNGISLDVSCDDDKQPQDLLCNSNGLWPYDFYVGFNNCELNEEILSCPLTLRLHRGWTPNLGGIQIPPFFSEIKPLNERLDIDIDVHYSVIIGDAESFNATTAMPTKGTQSLQNYKALKGSQQVQLDSSAQELLTGITGFGFELTEPLFLEPHWEMLGSDTRQRGRYIGKISFQAENPTINSFTDMAEFNYKMHVWSPITVVDSLVTTTLETTILGFNDNAETQDQKEARGRLCINSTEQAPAFSKWHQCHLNSWWNRWLYGAPQSEDQVTIQAKW
ncbi:MAG: hypothetical protein MI867_11310 [Pseudomonadales bacterium]|nr:hypothetical protein [Pseudomonadales bacterium]